jgi:hypothetical protein
VSVLLLLCVKCVPMHILTSHGGRSEQELSSDCLTHTLNLRTWMSEREEVSRASEWYASWVVPPCSPTAHQHSRRNNGFVC